MLKSLLSAFRGNDLVDDTVFERLIGGHEIVALGIESDLFDALAGALGKDLVELCAGAQDLLGMDLDIACLAMLSCNLSLIVVWIS